jgi:hypothetical protein
VTTVQERVDDAAITAEMTLPVLVRECEAQMRVVQTTRDEADWRAAKDRLEFIRALGRYVYADGWTGELKKRFGS